MKSAFRFALLALVLVIVAMISALTAMRFAIHGQEVPVPALVGMSPAEAERAATGAGLQMTIERQYYSPQIGEGKIMSQLPLPGTKVRRGWQVRVAQSLGAMRVAIPDVTGESEHAAELNIRRRGLDIVSMATVDAPGIPADQVLAQNPPANANDASAPNVSLLITAADAPLVFVMPSFVGQPLGTASRSLQDAGFKLGNVVGATPPSPPLVDATNPGNGIPAQPTAPVQPVQPSPASVIVSQAPTAGQRIILGSTITFEVR